jgi:uncharacterized membrane protein YdfJ with MMPL/SSD domain
MSPARARRRWIALGLFVLWLAIAGFAGPYSGKLADVEKNDNAALLPKTAESTEVNDLQQRFVDQDTTPGILLWERVADTSFPLFAFVFLVGLGIDYNIFLMTRVREETCTSAPAPACCAGSR